MPRVVSILLTSIATWFRSRLSLQMELIALRHQVAVYQQSISRPKLRPADRFLWVWLSRLWPGWQDALEFVQPRTVIAWQKQRFRDYWRRLSQSGKPGRPAIAKDVRELIRDMWRSNPTWGSPRIVGELHKIGIEVAKSTVERYRPKNRKPSSPTWKAFLANHVKDIVACDFFTVPTARCRVLFVFHHAGSRAPAHRALQHYRTPHRPVDRPTDRGSVPLGDGTALSAARSGRHLWRVVPATREEYGHRRGENSPPKSLAKSLWRAGHRQYAPRCPGSGDGVERATSTPGASIPY